MLPGRLTCHCRFYASLGSYRLSALVKEEYSPIGEVKNEALASDIRKLVLERLPLFLHERTQTRILLTPEWLSNPSSVFGQTERIRPDPSLQELHCEARQATSPNEDFEFPGQKELQTSGSVCCCPTGRTIQCFDTFPGHEHTSGYVRVCGFRYGYLLKR